MPRFKFLALTSFIVTIGVLILTTALGNQQQPGNEQKNRREETPDFSRCPIVDFQSPEPLEPTVRAAREAQPHRQCSSIFYWLNPLREFVGTEPKRTPYIYSSSPRSFPGDYVCDPPIVPDDY